MEAKDTEMDKESEGGGGGEHEGERGGLMNPVVELNNLWMLIRPCVIATNAVCF